MTGAVVTGAGGAMGAAIAQALADRGAELFLVDISERRLEATMQRLRAAGGVVAGHRADVTDREEAEQLVGQALDRFARVETLINVVGGYRGGLYESVLEISLDRFDDVMSRNLRGTFNLTQLFGRHMIDAGGGSIVNISSVAKSGASGQADYAAAKAGVVAFTRSCALELAPTVTVNAVAPGVIRTSAFDRVPEQIKNRYRERIPLGEFGSPEDVGAAVAYLTSPAGRYITAEVLHVSGGFNGWM